MTSACTELMMVLRSIKELRTKAQPEIERKKKIEKNQLSRFIYFPNDWTRIAFLHSVNGGGDGGADGKLGHRATSTTIDGHSSNKPTFLSSSTRELYFCTEIIELFLVSRHHRQCLAIVNIEFPLGRCGHSPTKMKVRRIKNRTTKSISSSKLFWKWEGKKTKNWTEKQKNWRVWGKIKSGNRQGKKPHSRFWWIVLDSSSLLTVWMWMEIHHRVLGCCSTLPPHTQT